MLASDVSTDETPTLATLWRDRPPAENAWLLGDLVLIHHRGDTVWARDARTGRHRWVHGYADGRRVAASEQAVVIADPGRLAALDLETGEEVWAHELAEAEIIVSLDVIGTAAAVVYRRGPAMMETACTLLLVALRDGAVIAEHQWPHRAWAGEAGDELVVSARESFGTWAGDGTLLPASRDSCFFTPDLVIEGPYCGSSSGFVERETVEARRRAGGEVVWSRSVRRVFPGPIVFYTDDAVLLASEDGRLELVELATGASRWILTLDLPSGWIPHAVQGNRAVLGFRTDPPRLLEIDLERGLIVREVLAPDEVGYLRRSGSLVLTFTPVETWVVDLEEHPESPR